MPPVDNETRHDASKQNVPMKNVVAMHRKNNWLKVFDNRQKFHPTKKTQSPPSINWVNFKMPGKVFRYPVFKITADVLVVVVVVLVIVTAWLIVASVVGSFILSQNPKPKTIFQSMIYDKNSDETDMLWVISLLLQKTKKSYDAKNISMQWCHSLSIQHNIKLQC